MRRKDAESYLRRKYGLSGQEVQLLQQAQKHVCAVWRRVIELFPYRGPHIDVWSGGIASAPERVRVARTGRDPARG